MQSTHGSSKGKDRAEEKDSAQAFASLSLSDYGDHYAPRSNSYKSSYPDVYGSFHEQPYLGDHSYGWMAQSSQSSSAYSGTPGYGNSYPTTSATSSTEGFDYRNDHSTSNYGSYAGYDTASTTGSSMSSHMWSDLHSRSTVASYAPLTHSCRTDVNNTIHRQGPANQRYQLPCEFHNLTGCDRVFTGDDEQGWVEHAESHLQSQFPTRLRCWFCSDQRFDARETSGGDAHSNFLTRMGHIRDHFVYDGFRREQIVTDGHLVQHLLDRNIIDRRTYESIINPTKVSPASPSHRRLPQVNEEVTDDSSSRQRHRSEHKRKQNRNYSKTQRTSRRGLQDRVTLRKLQPAPAVDSVDGTVPKTPVQDRSSPYSSSIMLENPSVAGSRISRTNTAGRRPKSKHSGNQSTENVSDETATDTVVNSLHELNIGHVGEASTDSSGHVQSLQSKDHSNAGPSSYSTDASTPESGSFWLAEYSEDDDNKLDEDHPFNQCRALAVARVFEAFHSWKESYSERNIEQDIPCDGVEESNPTPKKDKGKRNESEIGKRKRANLSEANQNKDNSNGPNRVGCGKRRRTSDRQLTFACPYTKKDPMSYKDCYGYKLSRIRDVKQHLGRCHRNPPYCPRCMGTFQTEEERDIHIREFMCPLREPIKLDGITESQGRQLSEKSAANTSQEAQWFVVFDIVFPGHKPRPQSPYVDRELLQDITHYQGFLTSNGPRILSEVLEQQGFIPFNYLSSDQQDLAALQRTVFADGLSTIFEQWLARQSSSTQDSDVPSSISGSNSQDTPRSSSHSRERVGSTSAHDTGAVPRETLGSLSGRKPVDALPDGDNNSRNSSEQAQSSTGGGLDRTFGLVDWDTILPAGFNYDGSDLGLVQLSREGALASPGLQLDRTEKDNSRPQGDAEHTFPP